MKIGDKVTYEHKGKTKTGVIHGVRKAENENGTERVIGYVIDTGKVEYEMGTSDAKGRKKDVFKQPVFVDLDPSEVKPVN